VPELSPRVLETRAIAEVLWFLPRPARHPIADKLHGLGMRVHPELATLQVETPGGKQFANITPQNVVKIDRESGVKFLREAGQATGSAHLQDLADRIDSADTPEKIAAERVRLAPEAAESLKVVEDQIGNVTPEDLE
jgi:hypothetical protein